MVRPFDDEIALVNNRAFRGTVLVETRQEYHGTYMRGQCEELGLTACIALFLGLGSYSRISAAHLVMLGMSIHAIRMKGMSLE